MRQLSFFYLQLDSISIIGKMLDIQGKVITNETNNKNR